MYELFETTYSGTYERGTFETIAKAQTWIEAHALEVGGYDDESYYGVEAPDGSLWYFSPVDGWVQDE